MTKSETKLLVGIGVLILLIDILLMKYWVSTIKPDPFMSEGVEFRRPIIFGINTLIGIIVLFFKKRLSILFFINAIVCYWIFLFFWNSYLENHPYSQTNYHFKIENRNLRLDISENPNTYGIYELDPNPADSLKIIEMGMNEKIGDSILLKGWNKGEFYDMYFYNNKLIGLPESPNPIELNKKEIKTNLFELKKLDSIKTTELLTQVFEDEKNGFLLTNCITEKTRGINYPMVTDFDEYVKNHLRIKDSTHYKLQSEIYKEFVLTSDIAHGMNIITQSQFIEFERKSELGEFRFWDWLEENCTDGYSSISKPIFNENFTLAYIQIGHVCGRLCGGGEERIYQFINGKWIEKENFGNWVS